jgi:hypothetical protein
MSGSTWKIDINGFPGKVTKKSTMAKAVKHVKATGRRTTASSRRKTWSEKMHPGREAEVKKTDKHFADIPAGSRMLIATPEIVDAYIRNIPKGETASLADIRRDLAAEYGADYTCPVTTGIFLRIVSEAAYEQFTEGKPLGKITPFWRVVGSKSPTAKKLSFPLSFITNQRAKEDIA